MTVTQLTRRRACGLIAAGVLAGSLLRRPVEAAEGTRVVTRKIPVSGEELPVIGMGSSNTFDAGDSAAERDPLREVLRLLVAAGGTVIDTSPMYGRSEEVLGDLIAELGLRPKLWIATKVWTRGREAGAAQIADSMQKLRTERLELLQIHNLLDWREHLPTVRGMKDAGKLRYMGVTHYRGDAHGDVERVLRAERFDWVQINYSLAEREAERALFPFCQERGIAVMANRPFADGALFERTRGKTLPPWAAEVGCTSWAQFFLRFAASHPAVTCVIPATAKPRHMQDNAAAGATPLPDAKQRARMAEYFSAL
jgi:aryl-alcohol dehydrogenase-like predicted oxidoreductase